ncbi:MAG TPA: pentapeptide repeat-containing protein [Solirubrobacterales bacterium]
MRRWNLPGRPGKRPLTDWQRPALDDPRTQDLVQEVVRRVLCAGLLAGAIVGLAPLFADDQEQARYAVTTVLVGLAAIAFAATVVARMRSEETARLIEEFPLHASGLQEEILRRSRVYQRTIEEAEPPLQLAGVDLREAVLPGVDLSRADLTGALLEGANLSAAALGRSRLLGTDLRRADLRGADLREADLRNTDLRGAVIDHARLQNAIYDDSTRWPQTVSNPWKREAIHIEDMPPR